MYGRLAALLLLSLCLVPASAEACACCDGYTRVRVLGWSASGRSVLLERRSAMACKLEQQLLVLRVDQGRVVRRLPLSRRASLARWFPQRSRPLDRARWRLQRVGTSKQWLRLFVRQGRGKAWRRAWQREVTPYRFSSPKDGHTTTYQPRVALLRPPHGKHVLLLVRHVDTMVGIGHHGTLTVALGVPR